MLQTLVDGPLGQCLRTVQMRVDSWKSTGAEAGRQILGTHLGLRIRAAKERQSAQYGNRARQVIENGFDRVMVRAYAPQQIVPDRVPIQHDARPLAQSGQEHQASVALDASLGRIDLRPTSSGEDRALDQVERGLGASVDRQRWVQKQRGQGVVYMTCGGATRTF